MTKSSGYFVNKLQIVLVSLGRLTPFSLYDEIISHESAFVEGKENKLIKIYIFF